MRQGPKRGRGRTTFLRYPVRLIEPKLLRINWDGVVPDLDVVLRHLGDTYRVMPVLEIRQQDWSQLTDEEKDQRIRDHLLRGDTFEARTLLQRKYGCSLTEADALAKKILGEPRRQDVQGS